MIRFFVITAGALLLVPGIVSGQPNDAAAHHQDQSHEKAQPVVANIQGREQQPENSQSYGGRAYCFPPINRTERWTLWVAIVTGLIVGYQAYQTRLATQEMKNSIVLQKVALQQSVSIGNWKAALGPRPGSPPDERNLKVLFDVTNTSDRLLGVNVHTAIDGQEFTSTGEWFLPPQAPYAVEIAVLLTGEQSAHYRDDFLAVDVRCVVSYVVLEESKSQIFAGLLKCNKQTVVFEPGIPMQKAEA